MYPSANFSRLFHLKDGDDVDYKDVSIGEQDENEPNQALEDMVDRAKKALPVDQVVIIKAMVPEYLDIFRFRRGKDRLVGVPPMVIEFDGPERPVKIRQRTYSPDQLSFLKNKVQELVDACFIYRNNASKWASAPLIVPKTSAEGYRFTVDLRSVNSQTKKAVWPMQSIEAMLSQLSRSTIWFHLDFLHGYWQ